MDNFQIVEKIDEYHFLAHQKKSKNDQILFLLTTIPLRTPLSPLIRKRIEVLLFLKDRKLVNLSQTFYWDGLKTKVEEFFPNEKMKKVFFCTVEKINGIKSLRSFLHQTNSNSEILTNSNVRIIMNGIMKILMHTHSLNECFANLSPLNVLIELDSDTKSQIQHVYLRNFNLFSSLSKNSNSNNENNVPNELDESIDYINVDFDKKFDPYSVSISSILQSRKSMRMKDGSERNMKKNFTLMEFNEKLLWYYSPQITFNHHNFQNSKDFLQNEFILRGNSNIHKNISNDIWSLGCIFAELLLPFPIFSSTLLSKQISNTINLLGYPKNESLRELLERGKKSGAFLMSELGGNMESRDLKISNLKKLFEFGRKEIKVNFSTIQILLWMLEFNHLQRPEVGILLDLPIFKQSYNIQFYRPKNETFTNKGNVIQNNMFQSVFHPQNESNDGLEHDHEEEVPQRDEIATPKINPKFISDRVKLDNIFSPTPLPQRITTKRVEQEMKTPKYLPNGRRVIENENVSKSLFGISNNNNEHESKRSNRVILDNLESEFKSKDNYDQREILEIEKNVDRKMNKLELESLFLVSILNDNEEEDEFPIIPIKKKKLKKKRKKYEEFHTFNNNNETPVRKSILKRKYDKKRKGKSIKRVVINTPGTEVRRKIRKKRIKKKIKKLEDMVLEDEILERDSNERDYHNNYKNHLVTNGDHEIDSEAIDRKHKNYSDTLEKFRQQLQEIQESNLIEMKKLKGINEDTRVNINVDELVEKKKRRRKKKSLKMIRKQKKMRDLLRKKKREIQLEREMLAKSLHYDNTEKYKNWNDESKLIMENDDNTFDGLLYKENEQEISTVSINTDIEGLKDKLFIQTHSQNIKNNFGNGIIIDSESIVSSSNNFQTEMEKIRKNQDEFIEQTKTMYLKK